MRVIDPVAQLSIGADLAEVSTAATWLAENSSRHGVPAAKMMCLDLCLDEVLMNIIMHSGTTPGTSRIDLQFVLHQQELGTEACVTVSDAGFPFNPLTVAPAAKPTSLADAEPGGLGLIILRANAERLTYDSQGGRNHLTFCVTWATPTDCGPSIGSAPDIKTTAAGASPA